MSCLKAKMHQIQFSWGSVPHAAGGAYSTPQTPQLDLKGPTSKGKEGRGKKGPKRKGRGEGVDIAWPDL